MNAHPDIVTRRPLSLDTKAALTVLTAMVAAGTVFLHLVGVEVQRSYLLHWHLDAGLFPKPVDWVLINGYEGVIVSGLGAVAVMAGHVLLLLLCSIPLGLYVWLLLSPLGLDRLRAPKWQWLSTPWGAPVATIVKSLVFLAALPLGLYAAMVLAALPVWIGHDVADSMAQRELADFRQGCDKSRAACVVLRRDGRDLAKGYVLDSSPAHIALFDVELQRSRALPRDGVETVGMRPLP